MYMCVVAFVNRCGLIFGRMWHERKRREGEMEEYK